MNKKLTFLLTGIMVAASMPMMTACDRWIDYVGELKLSDYYSESLNGKNFLDNGIGYATFKKHIDGDTTHWYQTEGGNPGRVVKSRYIGVDTPESTGQIEPWGKKASHFTEEKVTGAKSIILTSDIPDIGKVAAVDSTGTRFKTLVWVTDKDNPSLSDYKCLNLWLVQEGWSISKGMNGSPLTQRFTDAGLQAEKFKKGLWQGKDPDFDPNKASELIDLPTLCKTFEADGAGSQYIDKKLKVKGIVTKLAGDYDCYISTTDAAGKTYGLYVFAGYKYYSPMRTLGNEVEFVGTYTAYMGNPQLTSVAYSDFLPDPINDMKVISRGNPVTIPEKTAEEVLNRASINTVCTIRGLTIYKGKTEVDATTKVPSGALTFNAKDAAGKEISIRVPDDVHIFDEEGHRVRDWEVMNGKTVDITGVINFFAPDENDPDYGFYQIKLCHKDDWVTITTAE